jgi:hypothetical protein
VKAKTKASRASPKTAFGRLDKFSLAKFRYDCTLLQYMDLVSIRQANSFGMQKTCNRPVRCSSELASSTNTTLSPFVSQTSPLHSPIPGCHRICKTGRFRTKTGWVESGRLSFSHLQGRKSYAVRFPFAYSASVAVSIRLRPRARTKRVRTAMNTHERVIRGPLTNHKKQVRSRNRLQAKGARLARCNRSRFNDSTIQRFNDSTIQRFNV